MEDLSTESLDLELFTLVRKYKKALDYNQEQLEYYQKQIDIIKPKLESLLLVVNPLENPLEIGEAQIDDELIVDNSDHPQEHQMELFEPTKTLEKYSKRSLYVAQKIQRILERNRHGHFKVEYIVRETGFDTETVVETLAHYEEEKWYSHPNDPSCWSIAQNSKPKSRQGKSNSKKSYLERMPRSQFVDRSKPLSESVKKILEKAYPKTYNTMEVIETMYSSYTIDRWSADRLKEVKDAIGNTLCKYSKLGHWERAETGRYRAIAVNN